MINWPASVEICRNWAAATFGRDRGPIRLTARDDDRDDRGRANLRCRAWPVESGWRVQVVLAGFEIALVLFGRLGPDPVAVAHDRSHAPSGRGAEHFLRAAQRVDGKQRVPRMPKSEAMPAVPATPAPAMNDRR